MKVIEHLFYTPSVEIEDFNVFIDGKGFFDTSIKNKEEAYEKVRYGTTQ